MYAQFLHTIKVKDCLTLHMQMQIHQIVVAYISVQSSDAYMRQQLLTTFYIAGPIYGDYIRNDPCHLKYNT